MKRLAVGCLVVVGVAVGVALAAVVARGQWIGSETSGTQSPTPSSTPDTGTRPASTALPAVGATATLVLGTPPGSIQQGEKAYVAAIVRQEAALADSLKELEKLANAPNPLSSEWKRQVAVQLAVWRATLDEVTNMSVPDAFKNPHTKYVLGLSTCVRGADMVAEGIQRFNVQIVTEAANVMVSGYETVQEATADIHRLAKERGVE